MQLTSFTDYTLRVLMYLALQTKGLATIKGIADAYNISESHLMKVVHHLAKSGVVESIRGKGGGIRLAMPPSDIRIGRIVRAAESDAAIVECFGDSNSCCITRCCKLPRILEEAFATFYESLDHYTLADLVEHPRPLSRILQVGL